MILLIDNYDSFTYNIVQYCLELGADLKVIRNDELSLDEIIALNPSKIIISNKKVKIVLKFRYINAEIILININNIK